LSFDEYNMSPVYHTVHDSITYIDPVYCTQVVKAVLATTVHYSLLSSPPQNLEVGDLGNGSSLLLTWDPVVDPSVDHYKVSWGYEPWFYPNSQATASTSFTVEGLAEGVVCYVSVCSVDASGNESYAVHSSGTAYHLPQAPTGFQDAPFHDSIILGWDPNSELDLASYRIYRSLDPQIPGETIAQLPATQLGYADQDLPGLQEYYCYRLCAVDADGNEGLFTDVLTSRPVTLDNGILVIDETGDFGGANPFQPTDGQVDSFYEDILQDFPLAWQHDLAQMPSPLRLADIGIYSSILFHGNDFVDYQNGYLAREALREYVAQGGNLLVSTYHPGIAFELVSGYPAQIGPESFLGEVLGVAGVDYNSSARFRYAGASTGQVPDLEVDPMKTSPALNGHIFHIEAISPLASAQALYAYGSDYDPGSGQGSLNGQCIGVRNFHGSGQAVLLSFPLYNMLPDGACSLAQLVFGNWFGEASGNGDDTVPSPGGMILGSPAPNPFRAACRIELACREADDPVRVEVFNLRGQKVRTLYEGLPGPGRKLVWDGRDDKGGALGSGLYYIRARQNSRSSLQKVILFK
jgi:hypothetical protein